MVALLVDSTRLRENIAGEGVSRLSGKGIEQRRVLDGCTRLGRVSGIVVVRLYSAGRRIQQGRMLVGCLGREYSRVGCEGVALVWGETMVALLVGRTRLGG